MRGLAVVVFSAMLVASVGTARAEQLSSPATLQIPPMTAGQLALNCAMSGAVFVAMTAVGVMKPMTAALHFVPLAPLNEAIYGCGLGAISAFGVQSLLGLLPPLPMPPAPDHELGGQTPPHALFSPTATTLQ
jgi:hypothetical protein